MQAIPQAKIIRLWGHLESQFNVAVRSIGTGLDENHQKCACVIIDSSGVPDLKTLPDNFEGEKVRYDVTSGMPQPL